MEQLFNVTFWIIGGGIVMGLAGLPFRRLRPPAKILLAFSAGIGVIAVPAYVLYLFALR